MEGYPCKHLPPSRSEPSEPSSSRPILTSGCRLHPSLMKLIQDLSFSGLTHENPVDHVRDYERLIETRGKTGESPDARKRECFPLSLSGEARDWHRCFGRDYLTWERLRGAFCSHFIPIQRVILLRVKILCFKQCEEESLGMAWNRSASAVENFPVLYIPDWMSLQHFWFGLR